jgi:hypothetical protein
MRGMTVHQPWAELIAAGYKLVENRGTNTSHRGPIGIHAGLVWSVHAPNDPAVRAAWIELAIDAGRHDLAAEVTPHAPWIVRGAVIAVAELVGTHRAAPDGCCRPWGQQHHHFNSAGRIVPAWHWCLDNVRLLAEPVPCRGQVMPIWTLPAETAARVTALLPADKGGPA